MQMISLMDSELVKTVVMPTLIEHNEDHIPIRIVNNLDLHQIEKAWDRVLKISRLQQQYNYKDIFNIM